MLSTSRFLNHPHSPAFSCTWPTFYAALSRKSYGEKSPRLLDNTREKRKSVSQLINCAGGHDEPIEWATIDDIDIRPGRRKVCHINKNWNPIKWLLKISSCDIKTFTSKQLGLHICATAFHMERTRAKRERRKQLLLEWWSERSNVV